MNKKKMQNQLYDVSYVETIKELVDNSVLKIFRTKLRIYYKDRLRTFKNIDLYRVQKTEESAVGIKSKEEENERVSKVMEYSNRR